MPPSASERLNEGVGSRLDAVYGPAGMGFATRSGLIGDGLLEYVHVFVVPVPAPHYVYVSRGLHHWKHPHELVLRLAVPAEVAAPSFETAPLWPAQVFAAVADVTEHTGRTPGYGDALRNIDVPGLPFRHVVYLKDAGLEQVTDGPDLLAFVQVVPLDDTQLAELDALPDGAPMTFLQEWAARDPLLIR